MTFVSVGNVLVDILTRVPALPDRGGDVLGAASGMSAGGALNAMAAASRQGLPAAYAGGHGTGYFGDLVRRALRGSDIGVLLPPTLGRDSGYDLALVDEGGERTFVTCFGAEAAQTADALAAIELTAGDILHVSGYGLLDDTNASVLTPWLRAVNAAVTVIFDPGPLIGDIGAEAWEVAASRADWISCNEREANLRPLTGASRIVVRLGAAGCEIREGTSTVAVPGFPVRAVDSNGAGDAHVGAFAAALAAGLSPLEAARRANACAAIAVSRFGPATAPTLGEVRALIDGSA
jgi:sugar/nucleoside kinase (ribokinase family)